MNTDKIERNIEIAAPVQRVWRALTDHRQFGTWFMARLDNPFEPGQLVRGQMTYPGFEHLPFEAKVLKMEPERFFSFAWPPYSDDPEIDCSNEPWTTVEFRLEPSAQGTRLSVTETGFNALSEKLRATAYRCNQKGWEEQLGNIAKYVTKTPTEAARS